MSVRRSSVRTLARVVATLPVLALLTVIGSVTKVGPAVAGCAQASSGHHAALVVEHGDGAVITVCVAFSEDSITGDQLLQRSQVQYATTYDSSSGKAVCQIDGEPAQYPPSCWTASSPYWALYASRSGGSWAISSLGISSQTFRDGDAEGFRYEGQSDYSVPPSPRGVCPVASSPTPTPATTSTPVPARGTAHAAPSPAGPTPHPLSAIATTPSTAGLQPPSAAAGSSPTPRANIAASGTTPLSPPPASSSGAWAASGAGAALLLLLVVQLMRSRRRPPPWRGQP
jgi:hypothetical protein